PHSPTHSPGRRKRLLLRGRGLLARYNRRLSARACRCPPWNRSRLGKVTASIPSEWLQDHCHAIGSALPVRWEPPARHVDGTKTGGGLVLRRSLRPLGSRGTYNRVIGDENHDRTDHGDHETVEIQPRDPALAEERKNPPADDRTYDAEDQ